MRLREAAPAVPTFAALVAGVVASVKLTPSLWHLVSITALLGLLYLGRKAQLIAGRVPWVLGVWFLTGACLGWYQLGVEAEWRALLPEGEGVWRGRLYTEIALDGTVQRVLQLDHWPGRGRPVLRLLESAYSEPISPSVWASLPEGALLTVRGRLRHPAPSGNPGEFNYAAYLFRQGIAATVYVERVELEPGTLPLRVRAKVWARETLQRMRSYVTGTIRDSTSPEAAAILIAMITGRRELISEETDQVFRRSGTSHLLAVSGLHVGMVGALGLYLCRLVGLRGARTNWIVIPIIWLFVLQAGARVSSLRAGLMATLAFASQSLRRPVEPLQLWALSGILIVLLWPLHVFDVGFQLSYAATGGILLWLRVLRAGLPGQSHVERVLASAGISLAAQASTAPFVAFYFNELSLAGTWINWFAVPLAAPILYTAVLGLIFSVLWPAVGSRLVSIAGGTLEMGIAALEAIAARPGAAIEVAAPSPVHAMALGLIVVGLPLAFLKGEERTRQWGRRCLGWALVLYLVVSWAPVLKSLAGIVEVTFIDVGQGDAILIRTPRDRVILIDGGGVPRRAGEEGYDVGARRLVPYLRHLGVRRVDLLINTHPDEDHLQGLLAVLREREVQMVIDSGRTAATRTYAEFDEIVARLQIPRLVARRGDVIELEGDVWLEVLHPAGASPRSNLNESSVVLRLRTRHGAVLLTGDLPRSGQQELLWRAKNLKLDADVIKVPHHGAGRDVDWRFIDAVAPKVAVIQVGRNAFGHPSTETITAYAERGARVYRNDLHGAIRVYLTPWGIRVQTHRRG